jgi:stage V sporulation protein AB
MIVLAIVLCMAGGIAVGMGFVAVLIVLDVVPRLAHMTRMHRHTKVFSVAIVLGALCGVVWDSKTIVIGSGAVLLAVVGALHGAFIGMVAAALTEVLNVFPIVAAKLGLRHVVHMLVWVLVAGKVCGSLAAMFVLGAH